MQKSLIESTIAPCLKITVSVVGAGKSSGRLFHRAKQLRRMAPGAELKTARTPISVKGAEHPKNIRGWFDDAKCAASLPLSRRRLYQNTKNALLIIAARVRAYRFRLADEAHRVYVADKGCESSAIVDVIYYHRSTWA